MTRDISIFIGKLLLFLLPVIMVITCIEIGLKTIPNDYNTKRADFENRMKDIKILVLGNSQSFKGIDPALFDCPGFNLAYDSQPLSIDEALLLRYVDSMQHLKLVILNVSYFSLQYEIEKTPSAWQLFFYQHFWGLPPPPGSLLDPRRYSFMALYQPGSSLRYALQLFRVNLVQKGYQSSGWMPLPNRANDLPSEEYIHRRATDDFNSLMRAEAVAPNTAILDHILHELTKRNIQVTVVLPPLPTYFKERLQPKIFAQNKSIVESLCQKYHCQVLDTSASMSFTNADFADTDHVSVNGAKKLSRFLNDTIVHIVCAAK